MAQAKAHQLGGLVMGLGSHAQLERAGRLNHPLRSRNSRDRVVAAGAVGHVAIARHTDVICVRLWRGSHSREQVGVVGVIGKPGPGVALRQDVAVRVEEAQGR